MPLMLPGKHCPRLLDHRGFLICLRSLNRSDSCNGHVTVTIDYLLDVICTVYNCTSAQMAYHHLNNLSSQVFCFNENI